MIFILFQFFFLSNINSHEGSMLTDQCQTALGEPVPPKAVAMAVLALASHNFSSHIHGQVINVDSGKQGKVMRSKDEPAQYTR